MPSLTLLSLISLLAGAPVPAFQGGDGGQYTIAVDVDLVVFNLTVTDSRGRPVPGLKPADFQILEGNRRQEIKLFNAEDVPATIGIILDKSGSMRNKHADVANAALAFASASNLADELFVVNFNERVHLGLPPEIRFTNDLTQIRSALVQIPPQGLTALYDALAVGIEHLKTGTRDRKALVVLSDGGDNASRRRLDDVLQLAQRSSATIYTIGIYDHDNPDRKPDVLRKVAQTSGGRAYFPDSIDKLAQVWLEIAAGIRSQYTIGYRSSNADRDGLFRRVNIVAVGSGGGRLRVTTREGYVAPADKSISR